MTQKVNAFLIVVVLVLVVLVPWAEEIFDVIPHRNVKNSPDEIIIIRRRLSQFDVHESRLDACYRRTRTMYPSAFTPASKDEETTVVVWSSTISAGPVTRHPGSRSARA